MMDVVCRLSDKGIKLSVSDVALDYMLSQSYDPAYGA